MALQRDPAKYGIRWGRERAKKEPPFRTVLFPMPRTAQGSRPQKGRHQPCIGIVARLIGSVKLKVSIAKLVATEEGGRRGKMLTGGSCLGQSGVQLIHL